MAFHNYETLVLLKFLLVANLCLFPRSANGTPLAEVCPLVLDRTYCFNGFGSDPRTKSADMHLLAQVAIDKAQVGGTTIMKAIQDLERIIVNRELKALVTHCDYSYDDALKALKKTSADLSQGQFYALRMHARRAFHGATSCEASLRSRFKSSVTFDKKRFRNLCDIIEVIAHKLESGEQRILV